jgi:hypothetical protein
VSVCLRLHHPPSTAYGVLGQDRTTTPPHSVSLQKTTDIPDAPWHGYVQAAAGLVHVVPL